jgi:putative polyketide hydroxylase
MSGIDYEVAVIGGGPCGLLTALLLARRGIRCAVFERKIELLDHPKAMGISRRSAEILQQVGLRDRMRGADLGAPEYALSIWSESLAGAIYGSVPLHADDPGVAPYSGFHCPQTTTERVLLDALEQEPDASIFFDHEVMSISDLGDHVQVRVHRGRHDRTLEISSRFVVGADGASSPARHWLDIGAVGPGELGHFLNVYFRADYGSRLAGRRAVLQNVLRRDLFETFVAVNGEDLWLMHHFLQPGEKPEDYSPERLRDIVQYASGFEDVPVEVLSVKPWVMSPKVAEHFRKGNVFLTGDAAARLSPAAGLGMNTGLQSAHNLAWKLAAVLRGAPATLLDTYDSERRAQVMRTFETSNNFGSEVWAIIEAGFAGDFDKVRELVAGSRRGGSGLGLDLGWRYERGAFVPEAGSELVAADIDIYKPTAEPGRRAPHVWLEREGRRFSSLDLFGAGFALLTAGSGEVWRSAAPLEALYGGYDLEVFSIGGGGDYADAELQFEPIYGIGPGGAVLVRPDGAVGWRCGSLPADPRAAIAGAMAAILAGKQV